MRGGYGGEVLGRGGHRYQARADAQRRDPGHAHRARHP